MSGLSALAKRVKLHKRLLTTTRLEKGLLSKLLGVQFQQEQLCKYCWHSRLLSPYCWTPQYNLISLNKTNTGPSKSFKRPQHQIHPSKFFVLSTSCTKYHIREYSRDKIGNDEGEPSDTSGNNDGSGTETDYTAIHNDPWIRSLLADIKSDFDSDQHNPPHPDSEYKEPSGNNENEDKVDTMASSPPYGDYEYDYRYADDIEEFGYHDDSEIVSNLKSERQFPISFDRSLNGVFELEELITLVEHLGGENIVSIPIPPEANYCDHMVIVTAKSRRHLQAINEDMLYVHKRKKCRKDPVLHIEGLKKSEWCAMDLGNIVLHVFLNDEMRQFYDIESLWLLGAKDDPKSQEGHENSFVLSAEDLFWLETSGGKQPRTNENIDG